ncbi:hypothetical protein M422DRAFT_25140 [Sphaerobolus stellatus SS14]|nr:hypothetical protein M422DRAFT_25140 [Sphaerobolus stellatus SS14]
MADITQYIIRHQPKVREWEILEVQATMQFVESQLALAAQKDEDFGCGVRRCSMRILGKDWRQWDSDPLKRWKSAL